jgi:hypothetical protein
MIALWGDSYVWGFTLGFVPGKTDALSMHKATAGISLHRLSFTSQSFRFQGELFSRHPTPRGVHYIMNPLRLSREAGSSW